MEHIFKLGLIGKNIAHSKSPEIFKKAHPNWIYNLIDVESFADGFSIFKEEGYDAVNVTAPFKTEAFEAADTSEDLCFATGASNLLIKEDGKIKAYNTDILGATTCLKTLLSSHFRTEDTSKLKVLNIGLGGAGKAATVASLMMGFPTMCVNRTTQVMVEFKERVSKSNFDFPELEIDSLDRDGFSLSEAVENHDIIIYSLPIHLDSIKEIDFSNKAVIEAAYHNTTFPDNTICAKYIGGEVWLHAQAQTLLSLSI